MDESQFKALLDKYRQGTCSPEEIALLESWYLNRSQKDRLPTPELQELNTYQNLIWDDISRNTGIERSEPPKRITPLWPRIAAAASLIILLGFGAYLIQQHSKPQLQTAQSQQHDIQPGGNLAILTLSNGQKVTIGNIQSGKIASQAGQIILVQKNGQVHYTPDQTQNENQTEIYNTLTIPNGNQRDLLLADGTEVKLDAGSSITYPVSFSTKERRVSIIGQAEFKVKHNANQPFYVSAGGQEIEDIGTEFNIKAYPNEPVKTTLIEGKVTVNKRPLVPGQQAVLQEGQLTIGPGDPEEAAAWANGYFRFNNENIRQVMDKLKRWYNIEVIFEPGVTQEGFTGTVSRYKTISQVFYNLSYTQKIHYKIEGRRVTILK